MAGRSMYTEVTRPAVAETAKDVTDDREGGHRLGSWRPDDRSNSHATGHDPRTSVMTATARSVVDQGHVRAMAAAMTAAEVRQEVVRLVRVGRGGGDITAADVQRLTGRGPRQARRLLALATEEADRVSASPRPRVVRGTDDRR
jgi:hypothetical protein